MQTSVSKMKRDGEWIYEQEKACMSKERQQKMSATEAKWTERRLPVS